MQDWFSTRVELHLEAGNVIQLKNPTGAYLHFVNLDCLVLIKALPRIKMVSLDLGYYNEFYTTNVCQTFVIF